MPEIFDPDTTDEFLEIQLGALLHDDIDVECLHALGVRGHQCVGLSGAFDTPAGGDIRHSDDRVTKESLVAAIAADPRMKTRDKCGAYRELTFRSNVLTPDSYPLAGGVGCGAYPIADFPWDTPAVASAGD